MQARKDFQAGLAASFLVHGIVLALIPFIRPTAIPDIDGPAVSVTLVEPSPAPEGRPVPQSSVEQSRDPEETPAKTPEPASPPPSPSPPPAEHPTSHALGTAPVVPPPSDPVKKMTEAGRLYAAAVLARPENRAARDALKTLSAEERNEQLCDTEAMEQVRRADTSLRPDRLIAYALESTKVDGGRLHAPGAAFRSAHRWFSLTFDCTLDLQRQTVTAFRFAIGAPIPTSRWSDLQLER
ncbi:MAG TPA: DUF930 domain-containing protein [Ensifer sp.]|nr:DUF930 domain-containing protein [Ensifer sp.]